MQKLSLMILFIIATTAASGQELFVYEGNEATYKNNHFHMEHSGRMDTIKVTDPITGVEKMKIIDELQPVSINDRKIYKANQVYANPSSVPSSDWLDETLLNNVKTNSSIKSLPEGTLHFTLNYIVLDENGKIAFYDWDYIKWHEPNGIYRTVGFDIDSLLSNGPPMKPATLNGKNVPVLIRSELPNYIITIKNHQISWSKKAR